MPRQLSVQYSCLNYSSKILTSLLMQRLDEVKVTISGSNIADELSQWNDGEISEIDISGTLKQRSGDLTTYMPILVYDH